MELQKASAEGSDSLLSAADVISGEGGLGACRGSAEGISTAS